MAEIRLTEENFRSEAEGSALPVLIDFYADWCGPCRMLSPIIDEVAAEYDGQIKVCRVNVDDSPGLANRFGVDSIPTLVVMKNGKVTATAVGYRPKSDITALLK